jgi:hypothetical protein
LKIVAQPVLLCGQCSFDDPYSTVCVGDFCRPDRPPEQTLQFRHFRHRWSQLRSWQHGLWRLHSSQPETKFSIKAMVHRNVIFTHTRATTLTPLKYGWVEK